jgi:hypothetical protein
MKPKNRDRPSRLTSAPESDLSPISLCFVDLREKVMIPVFPSFSFWV